MLSASLNKTFPSFPSFRSPLEWSTNIARNNYNTFLETSIQLKFHTSADEYSYVIVCHNLENPVACRSATRSVTAANQVRPQPVQVPSKIFKKPKSLNPKPAPKHSKIRKEPGDADSDDLCGYCGRCYGSVSDPKSTDEWIECQNNAAFGYTNLVAMTEDNR